MQLKIIDLIIIFITVCFVVFVILYNSQCSEYFTKRQTHNSGIFMIVSGGCSGSTWVQSYFRSLLKKFNKGTTDILPWGEHGDSFEWYNKGKNQLCSKSRRCSREENKNIRGKGYIKATKKILQLLDKRKRVGENSYFVTKFSHLENADKLGKFLIGQGAKFVGVYRDNLLDHHLCNIKDCFGEENWGYSFDTETNTKVQSCFERRHLPSNPNVKVYVEPTELNNVFKKYDGRVDYYTRFMNSIGVEDPIVFKLSELSAFKYTDSHDDLVTSYKAWISFLLHMGLELSSHQRKILLSSLRDEQNTRNLTKHSDTILNYEGIKKIKGVSKFIK